MPRNRDQLLHRSDVAAWLLRRLSRVFDRLRYPLLSVGRGVDRLDRACGNAAWACRFKADRLKRGEGDDGIPF